jgi:hypothetical protein
VGSAVANVYVKKLRVRSIKIYTPEWSAHKKSSKHASSTR